MGSEEDAGEFKAGGDRREEFRERALGKGALGKSRGGGERAARLRREDGRLAETPGAAPLASAGCLPCRLLALPPLALRPSRRRGAPRAAAGGRRRCGALRCAAVPPRRGRPAG